MRPLPERLSPEPPRGAEHSFPLRMHSNVRMLRFSRAQTHRPKDAKHGGKDCHSLIEKAVKGAAFACGVQRWARTHLWRGFGGRAPNTLPRKEAFQITQRKAPSPPGRGLGVGLPSDRCRRHWEDICRRGISTAFPAYTLPSKTSRRYRVWNLQPGVLPC